MICWRNVWLCSGLTIRCYSLILPLTQKPQQNYFFRLVIVLNWNRLNCRNPNLRVCSIFYAGVKWLPVYTILFGGPKSHTCWRCRLLFNVRNNALNHTGCQRKIFKCVSMVWASAKYWRNSTINASHQFINHLFARMGDRYTHLKNTIFYQL